MRGMDRGQAPPEWRAYAQGLPDAGDGKEQQQGRENAAKI